MSLRPWLRLCRIPNVFTAFANVVAGVLLVRQGAFSADDLVVCAASGCLYLAGMTLNDFFDRHVDARERPERPIPSGEVTPAGALLLGLGLLVAGIGLAAACGPRPLAVAVLLTTAIVAYDARYKTTRLGPLVMGSCRALNLVLGTTVAPWPSPWIGWAAVTLGAFTVVLTLLSRDEVAGARVAATRRVVRGLAVGACFAPLGLVALGPLASLPLRVALAAPFAAYVAWRGFDLFGRLRFEASPPLIGRAIGGGILLMPVIDATFVAGAGHFWGAMAVASLSVPAGLLKRWYYLT